MCSLNSCQGFLYASKLLQRQSLSIIFPHRPPLPLLPPLSYLLSDKQVGPPTPHAPNFSQLTQGFKSILCPVNASNSCSNLLCSACPSLVYSHCPLWKSYLNGPLTGDDNHICLLGVCLLITKVPKPPNFTVNTPCCIYAYICI